jgi:hypothetical protein
MVTCDAIGDYFFFNGAFDSMLDKPYALILPSDVNGILAHRTLNPDEHY